MGAVPAAVLARVHEIPDARCERIIAIQVEVVHAVFAHGVEGLMDDVPQGHFLGHEEHGPTPGPVPGQGQEQAHGLEVGFVGGEGLGRAGRDDPEVVGLAIRCQRAGAVVDAVAGAEIFAVQPLQHPLGHGGLVGVRAGRGVLGAAQLEEAALHEGEGALADFVEVVGGAGRAGPAGEDQFAQGAIRQLRAFIREVQAHDEDEFRAVPRLGLQRDVVVPFDGRHEVPAPAVLFHRQHGVARLQVQVEAAIGAGGGKGWVPGRRDARLAVGVDPHARQAAMAVRDAAFQGRGAEA